MKINQALTKLTVKEKISLLTGDGLWHIKHLPKLGYKRFMMTDGPHGIRKQKSKDPMGIAASYPATCFPTASLLACSFDTDLMYEVGKSIGQEAINQDISMVLGPGINIKRNPLCGRNFEYFSEDPVLSGTLSKSYIEGMQSTNVGVSLKHYVANNQEKNRMTIDAIIDKRALYEIYLKGFGIAIRAKPWSIMTSYNKVNGSYIGESKLFLTAIARNRFGFNGAFITDWGAMNDRVKSLQAGMSLEMPGSKQKVIYKALKKHMISEKDIDRAVKPILWLLEKASEPKTKTNLTYHDVAYKAATESMVLLKNESNILPLNHQTSIALIGALAEKPRIQGSGSSKVNPVKVDSLLEQFKHSNIKFSYEQGYDLDNNKDDLLIEKAVLAAKNSDVVILSIGLTESYESEGFDRTHLNIPQNQISLIEALANITDNIVIILQGGAPTLMPYKPNVKAILNAYLAGEASGKAIFDILYGIVNPSGKLAETYPMLLDDVSSTPFFPGGTKSVYYAESIYVGYRYYDKKRLQVTYPFGYGLSYSSFGFANLTVSKSLLQEKEDITLSLDVTNTSSVDGKTVIQVYISDLGNEIHKPIKELKAFKKVFIEKGKTVSVKLDLKYNDFEYYCTDIDDYRVKQGVYEILIGDSSRDIHLRTKVDVLGDDIDKEETTVYSLLDRYIAVHDFEHIYGELPPREALIHQKIHFNSTIKDIQETRIGHIIYNIGLKEINKVTVDETTKKMMKEQFESLPLRAIPLFSGDKFTFRRVEGLIKLLNKDIRGLIQIL